MIDEMIGKRIEILRQKLKLQKKEMAEAIGITQNSYTNYCVNHTRPMPVEPLRALHKKYNVSYDWR